MIHWLDQFNVYVDFLKIKWGVSRFYVNMMLLLLNSVIFIHPVEIIRFTMMLLFIKFGNIYTPCRDSTLTWCYCLLNAVIFIPPENSTLTWCYCLLNSVIFVPPENSTLTWCYWLLNSIHFIHLIILHVNSLILPRDAITVRLF